MRMTLASGLASLPRAHATVEGLKDRILIIEDDPINGEMLRATLEYSGYKCDIALTAGAGVERLKRNLFHAVIVDLGLPDCSGLELIGALRLISQLPILVVSGHDEEAYKIAAFDNGADDYVVKPFLPAELAARVRAKMRQYRADQSGRTSRDQPFEEEAEVGLSRMERALLALLVRNQGQTVSEIDIIAAIWGAKSAATGADLRSLVLKVRRKLASRRQPLFILNERGVGYYVSSWGRFPRRQLPEADLIAAPQTSANPVPLQRYVTGLDDDAPKQMAG